MRFETQIPMHVPRQSAWDFLWDVPRLTACVPGCEAVQELEPNTRYQAVVRDKVGPFTLRVPLAVEVLKAPARLRARAQGRDAAVQSLVKIELTLVLVETSLQTTTLQVGADVTVLGK